MTNDRDMEPGRGARPRRGQRQWRQWRQWRRAGALALIALTAGCRRVAELREQMVPPSPHERYAGRLREVGLDATALGSEWLRAGENALRLARPVTLPAREVGYFAAGEAAAAGYRVRVARGQRLTVQVEASGGAPFLLFVDLFRVSGDTARAPERVASADSGTAALDVVADADGEFLVRLQPELLRGGRYTLTMRAGPSLAFPVEGRGGRAVKSLWGAARDGGRRRHEGIDIFAPRGTPVVAATEGTVAAVHTTSIGGKVVWLRDAGARQSLYYAHLDEQLVAVGQRVRVGDTLGRVGNTGNARTTSPHLHFGVYRRGGPVDPFPFVNEIRTAPPRVTAPLEALGEWRRVRRPTALRAALTPAAARATLARHTLLRVVGAAGDSYRVRLPDGAVGYVAASQVEPLDEPVARIRRGPAPILDRPALSAVPMDSVRAGESRPALGQFAGFVAVRTASGAIGWVAE